MGESRIVDYDWVMLHDKYLGNSSRYSLGPQFDRMKPQSKAKNFVFVGSRDFAEGKICMQWHFPLQLRLRMAEWRNDVKTEASDWQMISCKQIC